MKSYYRIFLGKASIYAKDCFEGGFVGTDFGLPIDLTDKLPDEWRNFNKEFIPKFLENKPGKTKVAAGLACGAIWTVSKGMNNGDTVLSPDGSGRYRIGEVTGDYYYKPSDILFHRRPIAWTDKYIDRSDMNDELKNSTGSMGTVANITKHAQQIESLINSDTRPQQNNLSENIEDPIAFAMEKHLELFLIENWKHTELGNDYDIYSDDDVTIGQQFQTDTGPMDILASSKDGNTLLVIELKKGRASDVVVGQTLRYMGYVKDVLAEEHQEVKGLIIALSDDKKLQRALVTLNGSIDFYRYEVSFNLRKVSSEF